MKKKVVKSILAVTVTAFMMAGLSGCQLLDLMNNQQTGVEVGSENMADTSESSNSGEAEENTNGNSQEGVTQPLVVATNFEHSYDGGYEQATITGMEEDGTVAWTYVSGKYEVGQLDSVEEIGMYNSMYYFTEDVSIIALDLNTGEIAWQNDEFEGYGISYCFDEKGTLYIAGYFGPDLMIIDKDGNTVLREADLDDSIHYWPYELTYEEGYVFVTYEACDDWNNRMPSQEWWDYSNWGSYTLNYCLADGSVGLEYNRMEPEPVYNGRYYNNGLYDNPKENADDSLQIDYIGDEMYRMNLCVDGVKYIEGIVGQLKDGCIEFRATYDDGSLYVGTVSQTTEDLVLKVTESTDAAIPAGSEFSFNIRSESTVLGQQTSFTMPDNWNYEFATPRIGTFYVDSTIDAGVVEAVNGNLFGFEEWLTSGCSIFCGCEIFYSHAEASSALASQGDKDYVPSNVAVGGQEMRSTVWAEGVAGDGIGEWIEIRQLFKGAGEDIFTFSEICIVNGYAEDEKKWQENNRVKTLRLYYGNVYMGEIHLEDTMNPQYIDLLPLQMTVGNGDEAQFRFEIVEVYEGTKYDDTCITGIVIDFLGAQAH